MNQEQVDSLIRTVLKVAGSVLMARGLSDYANIVNTEDVAGLLVGLVGIWLSHQTHGYELVDLSGESVPVTSAPAGGSRPTTAAAPAIAEVTAKAALPSRYPDPTPAASAYAALRAPDDHIFPPTNH